MLLGAVSLPLAFWPPFEDAFKLPQWLVVWIMLAGVWLALLGRLQVVLSWRFLPVGVLIIGYLLAAALGAYTRLSDTLWWTALAVIGVALPVALGNRPTVVPVLLVFAGAISAWYSMIQFAGFDVVSSLAAPGSRPFSTLGNPDFLAAFLVAVLPYAVIRWLTFPGLLRGVICLSMAVALLITQSRGAWLGVAASLAAAPLLLLVAGRRLRLNSGLRITLIAATGAVVIFFSLHDQARERLSNIASIRHFDAAGRLFMWRASMEIIRERPLLGWGLGSYGQVYPRKAAGLLQARDTFPYFYTENAHNDYLQLPAEIGLLGFGLTIWLWVLFFRRAWLVFQAGNLFGLGAMLGFLALQVNALFNFPWYLLPVHGWFWLTFGSLYMLSPSGEAGRAVQQGYAAPVPVKAVLGWVFLLFAGSVLAARDLQANAWLKFSGDFEASSRWREAFACAERSLLRWGVWEGRHRAANNASRAAYHLGDFAAAEQYARASLAFFPDWPATWSHLGLILARRGQYDKAQTACRRALALNPHQADSYHVLGNVAYLEGDRDSAARFWRKALVEQPELTGARESLESLVREKGDR